MLRTATFSCSSSTILNPDPEAGLLCPTARPTPSISGGVLLLEFGGRRQDAPGIASFYLRAV